MRAILLLIIPFVLLLGLLIMPYSLPSFTDFVVIELDNGIRIENTGTVECHILVTTSKWDKEFDLAVGESQIIKGISGPYGVSNVLIETLP